MRMAILSVCWIVGLGFASAQQQGAPSPPPGSGIPNIGAATDRPFRIVKQDPALDAIVSPTAKLELL